MYYLQKKLASQGFQTDLVTLARVWRGTNYCCYSAFHFGTGFNVLLEQVSAFWSSEISQVLITSDVEGTRVRKVDEFDNPRVKIHVNQKTVNTKLIIDQLIGKCKKKLLADWEMTMSVLAVNFLTLAVADPWGVRRTPPWTKIFLISCSFLGKSGEFVGWHPLLRGILDPPLVSIGISCCFVL